MLESFLVLLAGGIMLAVVISDPRQVTLNWLRLAGIIALVMAMLGLFWHATHGTSGKPTSTILLAAGCTAILAQLATSQLALRNLQRISAAVACVLAILAAGRIVPGSIVAEAGIAAMCGIALMDMLLGHAYLTASKMTMRPFQRLNGALIIVLIARVLCNIAAVVIERLHPIEMFWGKDGLLLGTRWFVGLLVPAVFLYMAHDCIKRRATQSATGILYVAGVLIFIGEIIALQLVRETGFPW